MTPRLKLSSTTSLTRTPPSGPPPLCVKSPIFPLPTEQRSDRSLDLSVPVPPSPLGTGLKPCFYVPGHPGVVPSSRARRGDGVHHSSDRSSGPQGHQLL